MGSAFLGIWADYKIKRAYCNDPSIEIMNAVNWFIFRLVVLMVSIPHIFFPRIRQILYDILNCIDVCRKTRNEKISKNQ